MNRQMQERIYWQEQRDSARQLKTTLFLGVIAFGVTLAVILGNKMDQATASVVVGVAAGAAASIPITFVLLMILRGRQQTSTHEQPVMRVARPARPQHTGIVPFGNAGGMMAPQPPVIVVTPAGNYDPRAQYQQGPIYPNQMPVLTPAPREFQMIGDSMWVVGDE